MRIIIPTGIFPPDIGGPASYVPRIASALQERGHSVKVITLADDPSGGGEHPCPIRRIRRGKNRLLRMGETIHEIRRSARRADLIYANGLFIEAAIAAALARKPLVMKIVGDWAWERAFNQKATCLPPREFQQANQGARWEGIKRLRTAVTRRADRLIVPSVFLVSILEAWPVEIGRITVIPNAMDRAPDPIPPVWPAFQGLTLVTASRLIRLKNIDLLIRLLGARSDYRLVIIGSGPEEENLRNLAGGLGVAARVLFTGELDPARLRGCLEAADLFVLNSIHEGLPHVILECFQAGLAVLATAVGGVPELITHGENGWLIPPGDEKALQSAADLLAADPALRQRLAAGGKTSLAGRFSPEAMAAETERVLLEAAGLGDV